MLELKERNGKKHIVSDDDLKAFAWAGYYANYSKIFINGEEYSVTHIVDSSINFSNGYVLPVGCYAIFENNSGIKVYDDNKLRGIRNDNPLKNHFVCFNDDTFLKIVQ